MLILLQSWQRELTWKVMDLFSQLLYFGWKLNILKKLSLEVYQLRTWCTHNFFTKLQTCSKKRCRVKYDNIFIRFIQMTIFIPLWIKSTTFSMSFSTSPLVVKAGVPSLIPLGFNALLSPGTEKESRENYPTDKQFIIHIICCV